ncbi:MAG: DUF6155 family protein [Methanobrevibacter sp.]|nr:DUF6155 family protein [Methanobrevibacter sp.]
MSKDELREYLNKLEKNELVEMVLSNYLTSEDAKTYLNYLKNPNENEEFLRVKSIIEDNYSFNGDNPPNPNIAASREAIKDFSKLNPSPNFLAKLLLYLVESMIDYSTEFGDFHDDFYTDVEETFTDALVLIQEHGLLEGFKEEVESSIEPASDYEFHGELIDIFFGFYLEILEKDGLLKKV